MSLSVESIFRTTNIALENIAHGNPFLASTYFAEAVTLHLPESPCVKGRFAVVKALQQFTPPGTKGIAALELTRLKVEELLPVGKCNRPPSPQYAVATTWKRREDKSTRDGLLMIIEEPLLNIPLISSLHFL